MKLSKRTLCLPSALAIAFLGESMLAQDRSSYPTQKNPANFSIDWVAFYDRADALSASARKRLEHHLDIPYGSTPKQKLDVYLPENADEAPVFVFIHGGGFVEGDRTHYGYVSLELAKRGAITVVMSYRLSPMHYPDPLQDTRAVVEWVHEHIETYGGDPESIYVGGHSAGAILSAAISVDRSWMDERKLPRSILRGFFPVSGPYDLREFGSFVDVYLPEPELRAEASPALNLNGSPPPSVVSFGGLEEVFRDQSQDFVEALKAEGGDTRLIELEGLNHDDTALALADGGSELARALFELMGLGSP